MTLSPEQLAMRLLALFKKKVDNRTSSPYKLDNLPYDIGGTDYAMDRDESRRCAIALNYLLSREYVAIDYFSGGKQLVISDSGMSAEIEL